MHIIQGGFCLYNVFSIWSLTFPPHFPVYSLLIILLGAVTRPFSQNPPNYVQNLMQCLAHKMLSKYWWENIARLYREGFYKGAAAYEAGNRMSMVTTDLGVKTRKALWIKEITFLYERFINLSIIFIFCINSYLPNIYHVLGTVLVARGRFMGFVERKQ